MPSYVTCLQIFISTLYSCYNLPLFIEIVFMPTINKTHYILFVRSFHCRLFTLSKRHHYIIRSISQAIISVLSELVTPEMLQPTPLKKSHPKIRSENQKGDNTITLCRSKITRKIIRLRILNHTRIQRYMVKSNLAQPRLNLEIGD